MHQAEGVEQDIEAVRCPEVAVRLLPYLGVGEDEYHADDHEQEYACQTCKWIEQINNWL